MKTTLRSYETGFSVQWRGLYLARKMADDLSIELRAEPTPGCGTAMILYFSVVKLWAPSLELI